MQRVIYVDVYFAINFLMDYIILFIAKQLLRDSKIIGKQTGSIRCVLSALFGSLYATFILVTKAKYGMFQMFVTYILVAIIMTVIAYKLKKVTDLIKATLVVYVVTFALNGIINYINYGSSWGRTVINAATANKFGNINILVLISAGVILHGIISTVIMFLVGNIKIQKSLYNVRIIRGDKEVVVNALCDTGNSLKEPYGGKPVSVLQYDVIKELLKNDEPVILIPYNSVGKSNGMLAGITADYMEVAKGKFSNMIANPVIGLHKGVLDADGKFEMLLHPDLTTSEGEVENEKCANNKNKRTECNSGN